MHRMLLLAIVVLSISALASGDDDIVSKVPAGDGTPSCHGPVLANGGFEELPDANQHRPPFWYLGFTDEPLPASAGEWKLDDEVSIEGSHSLKLSPSSEMGVSQILHLPTGLLAGRTLTISAWLRHEGTSQPPAVMLAALNPTLDDPTSPFDPGFAGMAQLQANQTEGSWQHYEASFTAIGPANVVFVYLWAPAGPGAAWFDDISVEADGWEIDGTAPLVTTPQPLTSRSFLMGFTTEAPMDLSEAGRRCLVEKTAQAADLLNVFFTVRWCKLGGDSCTSDPLHTLDLELVRQAREWGLPVALTFDFTHGSEEETGSIGDLNPLPDGSSPGTLLDEEIQTALADELLWLYDQVRPEVVLVGIEMDIMYERHPSWWPSFVSLQHRVYNAVKQRNPSTHVTAYHTIGWSVDEQGLLRQSSASVWRQLLGAIDSIAYSIYPNTSLPSLSIDHYPPGYFARPSDIAPELPTLIPELGMAGGGGSAFSLAAQAQVEQLMISELASTNPVAIIWFALFDRLYLAGPSWAQEAFNWLGMYEVNGAPKQSLAVWQQLHELPRTLPTVREVRARR